MEDLIELAHIVNEQKKNFQEESWKKMFKKDRRMFGIDSQLDFTDEERGIVDILEQIPSDYVPFSDTSDRMEDVSDFDEQESKVESIQHTQSTRGDIEEVVSPLSHAIEEEKGVYRDLNEDLPETGEPEIKKVNYLLELQLLTRKSCTLGC